MDTTLECSSPELLGGGLTDYSTVTLLLTLIPSESLSSMHMLLSEGMVAHGESGEVRQTVTADCLFTKLLLLSGVVPSVTLYGHLGAELVSTWNRKVSCESRWTGRVNKSKHITADENTAPAWYASAGLDVTSLVAA